MSELAHGGAIDGSGGEPRSGPKLDFATVRDGAVAFARSPAFIPAAALAAGLILVFWKLVSGLPELWLGDDGYYSHGFLIPFLSGYMVYLRWPEIKSTPLKPSNLAIVVLLPILWLAFAAQTSLWDAGSSIFFIVTLLVCTAIVAGWRWAWRFFIPICYLAFCLPMWSFVIDNLTTPLQQFSTTMAYSILKIAGYHPTLGLEDNATTIYLNRFVLDVAVPCSGLKLVIAVTAFSLLFMAIAGLRWWGNLVMLAIILPLCLFINGLRIALIGMVGDAWGDDAGHAFHDYSGYITLVICFLILMKVTRMLGWK